MQCSELGPMHMDRPTMEKAYSSSLSRAVALASLVALAHVADGEYCSATSKTCYPGTAAARNAAVRERAEALPSETLNGDWGTVLRPALLHACGLRDNDTARPGLGNTGHCFNDFNHVDCCTVHGSRAHRENLGQVEGIAYRNPLGAGTQLASLPAGEDGSGSWCTCQLGSREDPPRDVCHVQFGAAVGFKLVWCPGPATNHTTFALVGDDGELLASGTPTGASLPPLGERRANWQVVRGGKYAAACHKIFPAASE